MVITFFQGGLRTFLPFHNGGFVVIKVILQRALRIKCILATANLITSSFIMLTKIFFLTHAKFLSSNDVNGNKPKYQ